MNTVLKKKSISSFIAVLFFLALFQFTAFNTVFASSPWTVMVYLCGDNNLEGAAVKDLNEMEVYGSDDFGNVIVQLDRAYGHDSSNGNWTTTRRFHVKKDNHQHLIGSTMIEDLGEVNMGAPSNLIDFVRYSVEKYPAEHYALFIWNHGSGWKSRADSEVRASMERGVAYDDTDRDHLTMAEMKDALSEIKSILGQKLDLLEYDACLMAMMEIAWQAREDVRYFTASQEVEPGDGNPYNKIFKRINNRTDAKKFSKIICTEYIDSYDDSWRVMTKSATDLSSVNKVGQLLSKLSDSMTEKMPAIWKDLRSARISSKTYYDSDYYDLGDLLKNISKKINDEDIKSLAANALKAMNKAVIKNETTKDKYKKVNGLSIYFPGEDNKYMPYYDRLSFCSDIGWNKMLKSYFSELPPPSTDTDPYPDWGNTGDPWDDILDFGRMTGEMALHMKDLKTMSQSQQGSYEDSIKLLEDTIATLETEIRNCIQNAMMNYPDALSEYKAVLNKMPEIDRELISETIRSIASDLGCVELL